MQYIFFGTPEFAAIVLGKLIHADMPPVALVCNPDRPVGRKKVITPPLTKQLIASVIPAKAGIQVPVIIQPEALDRNFAQKIIEFKPDFAVVAAYAKIIPREVIALFPGGVIGVHPSLLPKYRGSSPIQSAILGDENETGVTLYLIDEKMDHGPVLATGHRQLATDTNYIGLQKQLAELGGDLLVETLPKFVAGRIKPQTQNESGATFTKKFTTQDGYIEENDLKTALSGANAEKAGEIDRKIRAFNPEPGAWTLREGKRVKLLESEVNSGKLTLKLIQEEGGKPRPA